MKNIIHSKSSGKKLLLLFLPVLGGVLLNSCGQLPSSNRVFNPAVPAELRLSYNSKTILLNDGKRKTEFHNKWVNFMDGNHEWKEIKPDFVKTTRGFEMTQAPFEVLAPFYADGEAVFNNNNRYDVFTQKIIYDKPLEQTIQALGTVHVAGQIETGNLGWGNTQYVVYPNAYPQYHADLIYWVHQGTAPRLRKFIRFNEQLSENTDFQFRVIYSDEVETVNNGKNVSVKLKGAESKRGSGWADFYIWDSKGGWDKREPIRFDFEKPQIASNTNMTTDANEYILTKHIDASYFKNATLPVFTDATSTFYPDPSPGLTTVDGGVGRNLSNGEDWATITSSAGTDADYTATTLSTMGSGSAGWRTRGGGWHQLYRSILLFDASSLGAGATISSATLSIYGSHIWNEGGPVPTIDIYSSNPASNLVLSPSDYSNLGTTPFTNSGLAWGSWSTSSYNDFTLNSAGIAAIDPTGIAKFGLRTHEDATGTAPSPQGGDEDNTSVQGYSADQTGTSQDPQLVVIYTPGSLTPAIVDWDNSNIEEITLSANRALTFADGNTGGVYGLLIKEDSLGGWQVTWPGNAKWAGGVAPTLATGPNAVNLVKFIYDGTNYLAYATTIDIK